MQVNHALVAIFKVASTSFNPIHENKILEKNFLIYSITGMCRPNAKLSLRRLSLKPTTYVSIEKQVNP